MKKYIFFFLLVSFIQILSYNKPQHIEFCIKLDYNPPKRKNDRSFDYTLQFLSDLIHRNYIGNEEAATMLQLLVFLAINNSPYSKTITLEIDGEKRKLPFSHELFWQLISMQQSEEVSRSGSQFEKRPHASSSFLDGYSDIE